MPNSVIAPVLARYYVCFFTNTNTHLLADINGWIANAGLDVFVYFNNTGEGHAVRNARLLSELTGADQRWS